MPATVAHIRCRTARTPEPARDYTADFERWVGYRLHPHARRVINILERQRARRLPQRLIVCNAERSIDVTRRTLADYVLWRATVVQPGEPFYVVGRTRADVRALLPRPRLRALLEEPNWQPILGTSRSPEYCRGLNFRLALLLDADRYPLRGRYLSRVWRSMIPCLMNTPDSLCVIHGTYRPRTRVNFFTRQVRLYRDSDLYWPVLDLTIPESEQPPDDAEVYDVTRAILLIPPWLYDADFDDPSIIYFTPTKRRYPARVGLF